ncbi:hypothetical protein LNA01_00970 [Companilactobacillus nantensis]|nr:hypothetical protein LNA01_00970 [Companilactobacillus nantensis]
MTSCESGVRTAAFAGITAPGVFGDLLARLQTEGRDLGSDRSAQQVNELASPETALFKPLSL